METTDQLFTVTEPPGNRITEIQFSPLLVGGNEVIIHAPSPVNRDSLFAPSNQECKRDKHDELKLQCTTLVLINEDTAIDHGSPLSVFFDESVRPPAIYIAYDSPQEPSEDFQIYEVQFTIDNFSLAHLSVETFLFNGDPVTSRGTETTVQNSDGS
ncbi:hypothetical protein POV27_14130 [Aureisphaera galaxeae]|uniref:hypothetical protein n=1 Tax=Aureisphaera galaxeae TaxID=1538023 RepID=UPI00235076C6|nr:hypothetical protein [Aureisphaera galaxeae]MDC8005195.1 hypothetical protein [Aureisphaera galaxeae]